MADVTTIDWRQLDSIRDALGEERTGGLLALYLHELASGQVMVEAAIGRSDLAGAAAVAHSLGGASANIGGQAVASAAARLHAALDPCSGEGACGLHRALRGFEAAIARTVATLSAPLPCRPLAA